MTKIMSKKDAGAKAVDLANEIENVIRGEETVVVMLAISMVLAGNFKNLCGEHFDQMFAMMKESASTYQKQNGWGQP